MKKQTLVWLILLTLLITAALCGYFFVRAYNIARQEIAEYAQVQSNYTSVIPALVPSYPRSPGPVPNPGEPLVVAQAISAETAHLPYTKADLEALRDDNPDTVGWVAIPDTAISYPVVQAKDNKKYLNLSFKGNWSEAGTPFADSGNDMQSLDANTIIYGHNMGAGRSDMFGELLQYKERDFYDAHRYVQFDTVYERHGWWKVFAVLEHDTRSTDFSYLHIWFDGDDTFPAWASAAAERSLYDSDMDISPRGNILTLSTCDRSRYGRYGRLLVLAVKMDSY